MLYSHGNYMAFEIIYETHELISAIKTRGRKLILSSNIIETT